MQNEVQNAITLKDLIPLISAAIAVVFLCIGWWVTHKFNAERDRQNKLREIRLQYMIDAYRNLIDLGYPEKDEGFDKQLKFTARDIQLFGTKKQIDLFFKVTSKERTTEDLRGLVEDLRNNLRKEMEFSEISNEISWLSPNRKKIVSS